MTQLLDDLRALDALFSDESKWTKGAFARTDRDRPIGPLEANASCWCLEGAAINVAKSAASHRYSRICNALHDAVPSRKGSDLHSFVLWQDAPDRTFGDAKSLIARAIATEEGRA